MSAPLLALPRQRRRAARPFATKVAEGPYTVWRGNTLMGSAGSRERAESMARVIGGCHVVERPRGGGR